MPIAPQDIPERARILNYFWKARKCRKGTRKRLCREFKGANVAGPANSVKAG